MTLLRSLTFLLGSLTVTLTVLLFWIYFYLLISSTMAFSPLGNSGHVAVSVSIDIPSKSKQGSPFYRIAFDYSRADRDGLCNLWDVQWKDILKLGASTAASRFCEWVQVGIDVPHRSIRSSLIKITFFDCTNKINLLNLKESSDRLVIVAKGFLKLPNLHMLIKQNSLLLPRNLALETFGELLIVFST